MKKTIILFIIFLSASTSVFSQTELTTDDSTQTMRLYIELGVTNGTMIHTNALMLTVNGGFVYDRFYIGGFGASLINDIQTPTDSLQYFVDMGFGGLHFGYDFFPKDNPFSLMAGLDMGMGTISVSLLSIDANSSRYLKLMRNTNAGLLVPSIKFGYRLFGSLTFNLVGSYTYITGYQSGGDIESGYFNSFSYGVSLKLEM